MANSILITQCLQNDFVKPIGKYEPLPNLLHIGYQESKRLVGTEIENNPISKTIEWAYEQNEDELDIIHIRDWHDSEDHNQLSHLNQFGEHCIKNTEGSEFIFKRENNKRKDNIVNALTLNDFQNTNFQDVLKPYENKKVKVGLMGVWTEAKIFFLTYELRTRYPDFEIAICSALTASSTLSGHFIALEQMEKLLGVNIYSSIGEFIEFLGGKSMDLPLTYSKQLEIISNDVINKTDEKLIRYVFRDCKKVQLNILDGGFSGNLVMGSESYDSFGHLQAPHVVKVGNQELIGKERASFERISQVLGNSAPSISDFADYAGRGIIKYRYASMGNGFSRSFQKLYEEGISLEKIKQITDTVFIEQLGKFYAVAKPESCNLLNYYQFDSKWSKSVRNKVESVLGSKAESEVLKFSNGKEFPNICLFYENDLDNFTKRKRETYYFSYLHGDLNGANIIIDNHENVWLIDFFHTHRGHVLKDLIKLENDVLYIFTKIENQEEFEEALKLTDIMFEVQDLAKPFPDISFKNEKINRAYETVKLLRSYYPNIIRIYRNPMQLFIGQMRYAVHSLSFEECNIWQKKWALYTASICSEKIKYHNYKNKNLYMSWIDSKYTKNGRIGLTVLPGRKDYHRNIKTDIETMKSEGITHVICLVTDIELHNYGVDSLIEDYRKEGLEAIHFPIFDQSVSNIEDMRKLVSDINSFLDNGSGVLLHCVGGLGRSGTVAACYLKSIGLDTDKAIFEVRKSRSQRAIESKIQENFVKDYIH